MLITLNQVFLHLIYFAKVIIAQNRQFDFSDQICPKSILPIQSKANKHHCQVQKVSISLATKFQSKQTILIFWTKLE